MTSEQAMKDRRITAVRAYERGRLREGALNALLALLLVTPGIILAGATVSSLSFAAPLALLVLAASTRGGSFAKVALPATVLGLVPLACALGASHMGHVCTLGGCVSLCLPVCSAGGLIAGGWLGRLAARDPHPLRTLALGGSLSALVGAIGCSCMGWSSTLAMASSIVLSSSLSSLLGQRSAA
ncbi:MAG TPA: hypothetical protein VLC09_17210 [Polyangiaceae bacterium]|nr:hypothetical protein [Polyangiaceae bacterium]